jgi:hypothetical protein
LIETLLLKVTALTPSMMQTLAELLFGTPVGVQLPPFVHEPLAPIDHVVNGDDSEHGVNAAAGVCARQRPPMAKASGETDASARRPTPGDRICLFM